MSLGKTERLVSESGKVTRKKSRRKFLQEAAVAGAGVAGLMLLDQKPARADGRRYKFRLNYFVITDTMAYHTDTDDVYFTIKCGGDPCWQTSRRMGDLNNGYYALNWDSPEIYIDDDTLVAMTYLINNNGHSSAAQQAQNYVNVGRTIVNIAEHIVELLDSEIATILKAIGIALDGISGLLEDCDGTVLSDGISLHGRDLRGLPYNTGGVYSETRCYKVDGRDGCRLAQPKGNCSESRHVCHGAAYAVTWSVIWLDKPKESKEEKDKEDKDYDKSDDKPIDEIILPMGAQAGRKNTRVSPDSPTPFDATVF